MILAIRYVEKEGGYWEVRTKENLERHTSLRQFQATDEVALLATRALQVPGIWVDIASKKEAFQDE